MRQLEEDLNRSTEFKTDCSKSDLNRFDATTTTTTTTKGLEVGITVVASNNDDNDGESYELQVRCNGELEREGEWQDVAVFWPRCDGMDTMRDLFVEYSRLHYPERIGTDNLRPEHCFLRDEPGISYYRDFHWNPVKLSLRGDAAQVEILERYTCPVTLEQIPVDFMCDLESILIRQGDKAVTSTLIKSPLQGHPLAMSMMTTETKTTVELRGLNSVVSVLGNDGAPHEIDETSGNRTWKDVKTLRALLHGKTLPQKEGKGTKRTIDVVALESFVKARIHYHASLEGDMVSDHGDGLQMMGYRWWKHPIQDMMNGFKVENMVKVYEDIELRFYSEIEYKMDNEFFDWEKHDGRWVKVPKESKSIRMNLL